MFGRGADLASWAAYRLALLGSSRCAGVAGRGAPAGAASGKASASLRTDMSIASEDDGRIAALVGLQRSAPEPSPSGSSA